MTKKDKRKIIFNSTILHNEKSLAPHPEIVLKSFMFFLIAIFLLFFDFFVVTSKEISNFEIINSFLALENQ